MCNRRVVQRAVGAVVPHEAQRRVGERAHQQLDPGRAANDKARRRADQRIQVPAHVAPAGDNMLSWMGSRRIVVQLVDCREQWQAMLVGQRRDRARQLERDSQGAQLGATLVVDRRPALAD
jgi:hypothetical protein